MGRGRRRRRPGAEAAPLCIIVAVATLTTGLADTNLFNEGGDVSISGPAIHDGATKGIRWLASPSVLSDSLCWFNPLHRGNACKPNFKQPKFHANTPIPTVVQAPGEA